MIPLMRSPLFFRILTHDDFESKMFFYIYRIVEGGEWGDSSLIQAEIYAI